MKTMLFSLWILSQAAASGAAVATVGTVPSATRTIASPVHTGGVTGGASVDTTVLMGPGGAYPYRGDFETAWPLPAGDGLLPDGWTSVDVTQPANHWHVDTYDNPGTGLGAWCGSLGFDSCDAGDQAGGYGNGWKDVLEFRKSVPGAATVRVQGALRFDVEPGYDYVTLQRRTQAYPDFEPVSSGQGLSWDGQGTVQVDCTFNYAAAERVDGTDIAIAFVVTTDSGWSDEDCGWPTAGAAMVDDLVVTVTSGAPANYVEDFEDGALGPHWAATLQPGVGDYARVWRGLCDEDPCRDNPTNQVAFIDPDFDDPWILPPPPPPDGCGMVNNTGGALGPGHHLDNAARSPVMAIPAGAGDGLTLSFDVYVHELLIPNDTPGMLYYWGVRSAAGEGIEWSDWRDRDGLYFGGPEIRHVHQQIGDLLEPGATAVQVQLGVYEIGWMYGYGDGTNGTPAPYFDNVRVEVYPSAGPFLIAREEHLANDGFPASGSVDRVNLGANSVRFDMAANIAARSHLRNDPGDSVCIDASPRAGGTLDAPVMHWTLARRNPLFDPYRTLPASPVVGRVTRSAIGQIEANRWNFDLPDTGMLFPGDVLHYYFSATDHVGGDTRTATLPADLTGFGDPDPLAWSGLYTVRCLPTLWDADQQPRTLFWNDGGFSGGEYAWYRALLHNGMVAGATVDIFTTHAPTKGCGNGLGGRATAAQLAGYDDLIYTSGDLSSPTLSNGDLAGDPGDDLGVLADWLAPGGRGLLLTGDDLANSLATSGTRAQAFLEDVLGVQYVDRDVSDNIDGQVGPVVASLPGNPVFLRANDWLAWGGCPALTDFDAILPVGGGTRVAQFTAPDGVSTPYPYAAAVLNVSGTNRAVTLNHDLAHIMAWDKSPVPPHPRDVVLGDVLDYLAVVRDPITVDAPATAPGLTVHSHPNPFNPQVTLRWTLARPGLLTMKVFDARGALVRTLHDGAVTTTGGALTWSGDRDDGSAVASGLYFVETRGDGQVDVRKITMLK